MLVTAAGIVTSVRELQNANAEFPTSVTGLPPMAVGTTIAPCVDVGTAGFPSEPPPTLALPPVTVYVQVMPVAGSVHVSAMSGEAASSMPHTRLDFISRLVVLVAIFFPFVGETGWLSVHELDAAEAHGAVCVDVDHGHGSVGVSSSSATEVSDIDSISAMDVSPARIISTPFCSMGR